MRQLIADEKFTNIQRAQAGLTRLFEEADKSYSFYRVMKNDEPLGVLIPNEMWEDFVEDMEAISSPAFRARIAKSRKEKGGISLEQLKKKYNVALNIFFVGTQRNNLPNLILKSNPQLSKSSPFLRPHQILSRLRKS